MTTTPRRRARGERRRGDQRGRQRWLYFAVAGVGVVLAGLLLWTSGALGGAGSQVGQPVDRFMHVHGLAMPAWAPDAVYLSTHQGLVRIDDDRWRFVSEQPHDFMGFAHHPERADVLFSSGHPAPGSGLRNPIGFMVSEDGGVTWDTVSLAGEVDFHVMTVSHADPDVIYGWNASGAAGLHRSADGGRSWNRPAAAELMAAGGVYALAAHPEQAATVLAGTPNGLWRSTDGGETWELLLPALPVTAVAFESGAATGAIAYLADGQTGLARIDDVEDAAASVAPLGLLLPGNDAVFHIAIHPMREGVVYVGSGGQQIFATVDGGEHWRQIARDGVPLGAGEQ